ncbi:MAG: hypothetical protein J5I94_03395 [Phaeodactylibacter sp.]|nr:hypothetical protein [Phaeodactylibacter sp.]
MKRLFSYSFIFAAFLLPSIPSAQPEIISLAPSAALPGEKLNVAVTGANTSFQQGRTTLSLGPGVRILEVRVNHPLFLTALVEVDDNAAPGFFGLDVKTGNELVSLPQAFTILEPGASVNVVLTIIPVQALYLSDLDPNDPVNNPLLFNVTLYNDGQERSLRVRYILSNEEFGAIGAADKVFPNLAPFAVEVFDNRQFDEYDLSPESPELLNIAASTGVVPAGAYTYTVLVLDETGNAIARDEGVNVVTNETTIIDLIGPGAPLGERPEEVSLSTPFFQWFSTLNNFHFTLYEVNEGQQSAIDITANLPVYEERGLAASFLQYPLSAELLERGKTYAWQVTAPLSGSQGNERVYSEAFWFRVGDDGTEPGFALATLEVKPEVANLQAGQSYQFSATGYGQNGEPAQLNCDWSVVPSTAGTVSPDGLFTAGSHPGAAAVAARCGGLQAYATAVISWSVTDQFFDVRKLFDQVFGLEPDR